MLVLVTQSSEMGESSGSAQTRSSSLDTPLDDPAAKTGAEPLTDVAMKIGPSPKPAVDSAPLQNVPMQNVPLQNPPGYSPAAFAIGPLPEPSNVLLDPYVGRAPPPPPKRPLSPAAVAAAFLAILPIGSLAAIAVGFRGLKQVKLGTVRGRGLALGAIIAGVIFTAAYGTAAAIVTKNYLDDTKAKQAREDRKWERKQREREEEEAAKRQKEAKATPPASSTSPSPSSSARPTPPPTGTVPENTIETKVGDVLVIDMGFKEPSLKEALLREQKEAKAEGKEILVMTQRSGCGPCEGVMKSLPDPKMQAALAKIRLVRLDVEVFRDDLKELRFSTAFIPGFFLLHERNDGSPRDGINGGEWGDDIASNIAPVLEPFVRGQYKQRKKPFPVESTPPTGTFL